MVNTPFSRWGLQYIWDNPKSKRLQPSGLLLLQHPQTFALEMLKWNRRAPSSWDTPLGTLELGTSEFQSEVFYPSLIKRDYFPLDSALKI